MFSIPRGFQTVVHILGPLWVFTLFGAGHEFCQQSGINNGLMTEQHFCSVLPRNFITGDNVPGLLKKWGHLRKKWGHFGENDGTSDLEVKNQFVIGLHHY